ncbi:hypothetical protein ACFYYB_40870 [Streptomyces sp. NPDC002886]|uniref:hypothetical protein n=1 Tax=Streptomyces sp. NPDC002886 TaxID=3364667 RepID=UPI0036CA2A5C
MVEVRSANPEAHCGLIRAEGDVPVQKGLQVPAAREGSHLVRMDFGELEVAAEADEETGPDKVADRCGGHPRPARREGHAKGLRQPVCRHPGPDRAPQRGPYLLRVGPLHHRPRPQPRAGVCQRDQARSGRPPPSRQGHPQPSCGLAPVVLLPH